MYTCSKDSIRTETRTKYLHSLERATRTGCKKTEAGTIKKQQKTRTGCEHEYIQRLGHMYNKKD